MTYRVHLVVVGGGIVGLSAAMAVLQHRPGLRVIVLEKEREVATHQTAHNSGVIHSGVYYKPGSLKAKLCIAGAAAMIAFCRKHAIPHEICGKVIVAVNEAELPALQELKRRSEANGVPGVALIQRERLAELEPRCAGIAALHVPGTAITDFALVARKYAECIIEQGGEIRTGAKLVRIKRTAQEIVLETTVGDIAAEAVVNCAGLHSDRIAKLAEEEPEIRIVPFRGEYYELTPSARLLVRNLIYPVPDPRLPFLGVHFTRRIGGGMEAGPNAVFAFSREGYGKLRVSLSDTFEAVAFAGFWRMAALQWRGALKEYYRSFSKEAFVRELQRLVPEVQADDLSAGGTGVRAQAIDSKGALLDDFRFLTRDGFVHALNVPSPAATASLPIGHVIADQLEPLLAKMH